jgi:hypothetical protein
MFRSGQILLPSTTNTVRRCEELGACIRRDIVTEVGNILNA